MWTWRGKGEWWDRAIYDLTSDSTQIRRDSQRAGDSNTGGQADAQGHFCDCGQLVSNVGDFQFWHIRPFPLLV
jgi:hypothetical protein